MGAHICFHCAVPVFYNKHLPTRAQYDPHWRDIHAEDLEQRWLDLFKKVLIEARDVKGQITYAVFNVKPPEQAVLDR